MHYTRSSYDVKKVASLIESSTSDPYTVLSENGWSDNLGWIETGWSDNLGGSKLVGLTTSVGSKLIQPCSALPP